MQYSNLHHLSLKYSFLNLLITKFYSFFSAANCLFRGKCNVTLLNETDVLAGYLEKEVRHHLFTLTLKCHTVKVVKSETHGIRTATVTCSFVLSRIVSFTLWCLIQSRKPSWRIRVRSVWAPSTRQKFLTC